MWNTTFVTANQIQASNVGIHMSEGICFHMRFEEFRNKTLKGQVISLDIFLGQTGASIYREVRFSANTQVPC